MDVVNSTNIELNSLDRPSFSWSLYAISYLLTLLAIASGSRTTRLLFLITIICIYFHLTFHTTTHDVVMDIGLGSAMLTQVMVVVDYLGLSDVERELRRLKDEKREGKDGMKGGFSKKPFMARLKWSFDLLVTSRGIGWAHQPSALPPAPTCTCKQFIATRLLRIAFYVALDAAAQTMNVHNPVLMSTTPTSLVDHGLYYRMLGILGFAGATYARINGLFCFAGIFSVVFGFSEPRDWPDLYGGVAEAWSVQKFWGRTWHQLMRRSLRTSTNFIVHRVLRLPHSSTHVAAKPWSSVRSLTSALWILTAFFISGLIHIGGEYMMLGRVFTSRLVPLSLAFHFEDGMTPWWASSSLHFFVLQGIVIVFEGVVSRAFSSRCMRSNAKGDFIHTLPLRIVGYTWVVGWFTWSVPLFIDPMIATGQFFEYRGVGLGWLWRMMSQEAGGGGVD